MGRAKVDNLWLRMNLRDPVAAFLKPSGRAAFLASLPERFTLLDVGCGNSSPYAVKRVRPNCKYIGLDVGDYQQSAESLKCADEYVIVAAEIFCEAIKKVRADVVISSHNLEHCYDPKATLAAMCNILSAGGLLYLSFPSEASVRLPSRKGTLNFYDDATHRQVPNLRFVLKVLDDNKMTVIRLKKRYRPLILFLFGMLVEPIARVMNTQAPFGATWALYGFETVIWARKAAR